jgi:hypothetical protein
VDADGGLSIINAALSVRLNSSVEGVGGADVGVEDTDGLSIWKKMVDCDLGE